MTISDDTRALVLLMARLANFGLAMKPLTQSQWYDLRKHLEDQDKSPKDLLQKNRADHLRGYKNRFITADHVAALLNRTEAVDTAIVSEEWNGIWLMSYLDDDYPELLRNRLGIKESPPLFFGCGNRSLLGSERQLAVVGSRNAPQEDLGFAKELGAEAAGKGLTVVSGGARGVDEHAMCGSLAAGGKAIGVLPYFRKSTGRQWGEFTEAGDLALVSVTDPGRSLYSRSYVGAAMQRNAYIYCLSTAAVVVHSGSKGGTWSGATKALKRNWRVPVWLYPTDDPKAGNKDLWYEAEQSKRYKGYKRRLCDTVELWNSICPRTRLFRAVLLLTTELAPASDYRPLDFNEWGDFAKWLHERGRKPSDLLLHPAESILKGLRHKTISIDRISKLLDLQEALDRAQNRWSTNNVWYRTRAHTDYPRVLKTKMRHHSPAVIFGIGNPESMGLGGLATVGPDDAGGRESNLRVAKVDRGDGKDAVLPALKQGTRVVGIVAGNLHGWAESYRQYIDVGRLILLSTLHPYAEAEHPDSRLDTHHQEIADALRGPP